MKSAKKLASVLFAALLALSTLSTAFAASKVILSGTAGPNVRWTLTDDGVLTVSGSGAIIDETETIHNEEYDYDYDVTHTIGSAVSDYLYGDAADPNDTALLRAMFDLVKELVVEEGITEIPAHEFDNFCPRKISLPASLEFLGDYAFDASFAESVTILSRALPTVNFIIPCTPTDCENPLTTADEAIQAYLEQNDRLNDFTDSMIPCYALICIVSLQNGLDIDQTAEEILDEYNAALGTNAATLDELAQIALAKLNEHFGTSYTKVSDVVTTWSEDGFTYATTTDEFDSVLSEKVNSISDPRLDSMVFGEAPEEGMTPASWFTVTAYSGSRSHYNSTKSQNNLICICPLCNKIHNPSGTLLGWIIEEIHFILYEILQPINYYYDMGFFGFVEAIVIS